MSVTPPVHPTAPAPHEVDVVIVSYRCASHLRACLASLAAQAPVAMRVEVVDNASGDGTADVAERTRGVVVTRNPVNVGFARANNAAISRGGAPAVLVLNPDTVLPPGALRACLDELARHPDVGVLTPRLVGPDGRMDRRCRRGTPTVWGAICFLTGLDRVIPGRRARSYTLGHLPEDAPCDAHCASGAFMLMRRAALDGVGLFDERYFMYAEDMDLCLRMRAAGWRVRYWPGVDVLHTGGGSGADGRRTARADRAFFRSMAPFMRRHAPGPRGVVAAAVVAVLAEAGLAASRLRRLSAGARAATGARGRRPPSS